MEVLGIIPARGGSKGIPRKNLKSLAGKPMIEYTIDAARGAKSVGRTILSTDDSEIAEFGRQRGVEVPFKRPDELAEDRSTMISVVTHALSFLLEKENYAPDVVLLLQPTSPMRTARHIDEALSAFELRKPDTLVSVTAVPHRFNPESIYTMESDFLVPQKKETIFDRSLKPTYFARNGPAILACTRQTILLKNSFYGERISPYKMTEEDSLDIDTPFDFEIAQFLLEKRKLASAR